MFHTYEGESGYHVFETFYFQPHDKNDTQPEGWYWVRRYPGCDPIGEPSGPFDSEEAAIGDANDSNWG
jgi:hypothetical protein